MSIDQAKNNLSFFLVPKRNALNFKCLNEKIQKKKYIKREGKVIRSHGNTEKMH